MSDDEKLPEKRQVARKLLVKGSVMVHLDPRHPGVSVPDHLAKQAQLVLQIGLDLPVPIPDLRVDEQGVQATLSFNRTPHLCRIPWAAVFAMVGEDGQGLVWPESFPTEIRHEVEREAGQRPAPGLRLIDGDADKPTEETVKSRPRGPRLQPVAEPIIESKAAEPKPALSLAPESEETVIGLAGKRSPLARPDDAAGVTDATAPEPDTDGDDPSPSEPSPRHLRLVKS